MCVYVSVALCFRRMEKMTTKIGRQNDYIMKVFFIKDLSKNIVIELDIGIEWKTFREYNQNILYCTIDFFVYS